ncbi:MAG: Uma2 family endonuclease [Cyanothece sp. SIO1E1]|nr:Uma2 family endonuclease [Cyanothece sp. SIO1E1]
MIQAPNRPAPKEQHFTYSGLNWEQFKALQSAFADSPGVRVSYFQGEVELLAVSPEHGIAAGNLGYLIEDYMLNTSIDFIGLEDYSIESKGVASAQGDKPYCFDELKSAPDLVIEVVITGEGETKLKRYAALNVAEIWFWIDGQISVQRLKNGKYERLEKSEWLPELNLDLLAKCASIQSRTKAVQAFRKG